MTRFQSSTPLVPGQVARTLHAIAVASLLALGVAAADQGQRSTSPRDASRQTVQPGQAPSSRREPSRIRNEDEPRPTVQNRAPEVMVRPPAPTPTPVPPGGGN